jgi:Flp pilus assembly protein TadB
VERHWFCEGRKGKLTVTVNENERLARIEALLDFISKRQEEDREFHKVENERAKESRVNVREELQRLASEQKSLNDWRKEKVDPFVDMGTGLKAKITGAILVLGLVGGIVLTGMQYFKQQILGAMGL